MSLSLVLRPEDKPACVQKSWWLTSSKDMPKPDPTQSAAALGLVDSKAALTQDENLAD